MKNPFTTELKPVPCSCGADVCNRTGLNVGMFYQGNGFEPDEAEFICRAVNEKLLQLDKYDYTLIKLIKLHSPVTDIIEFWAERNAVNASQINITFILERMFNIVFAVSNRRQMLSLMWDLNPEEQWKFVMDKTKNEFSKDDYWGQWYRVLYSRIQLTEIKKLPGYAEYVDFVENNSDYGLMKASFIEISENKEFLKSPDIVVQRRRFYNKRVEILKARINQLEKITKVAGLKFIVKNSLA